MNVWVISYINKAEERVVSEVLIDDIDLVKQSWNMTWSTTPKESIPACIEETKNIIRWADGTIAKRFIITDTVTHF